MGSGEQTVSSVSDDDWVVCRRSVCSERQVRARPKKSRRVLTPATGTMSSQFAAHFPLYCHSIFVSLLLRARWLTTRLVASSVTPGVNLHLFWRTYKSGSARALNLEAAARVLLCQASVDDIKESL